MAYSSSKFWNGISGKKKDEQVQQQQPVSKVKAGSGTYDPGTFEKSIQNIVASRQKQKASVDSSRSNSAYDRYISEKYGSNTEKSSSSQRSVLADTGSKQSNSNTQYSMSTSSYLKKMMDDTKAKRDSLKSKYNSLNDLLISSGETPQYDEEGNARYSANVDRTNQELKDISKQLNAANEQYDLLMRQYNLAVSGEKVASYDKNRSENWFPEAAKAGSSFVNPGYGETGDVQNELEFFLDNVDEVENPYDDMEEIRGANRNQYAVIQKGVAKYWKYVDDPEREMYAAILSHDGKDAAEQYLNDLEVELAKRASKTLSDETKQQYENSGTLGKIGMNAGAVVSDIMGAPLAYASDTYGLATGKYNPYSYANMPLQYSDEVKGLTSNDIQGYYDEKAKDKAIDSYEGIQLIKDQIDELKQQKNVYLAAMRADEGGIDYQNLVSKIDREIADLENQLSQKREESKTAQNLEDAQVHSVLGEFMSNGYQAAMSGVESAIGATVMGPAYTVSMGMGAASRRAKELYEKGASTDEIALGSFASGVVEGLFEYVSLDKFAENFLNGNINGLSDFVKKTLLQGGIEASEEINTEIANMIIDSWIMGYNSDHNDAIRQYVEAGYSYEEASRRAMVDDAISVFWAAYGGFISGGAMGGAGGVLNVAANKLAGRNANTQQNAAIPSENPGNNAVSAVNETVETQVQKDTIASAAESYGNLGRVSNSSVENILSDAEAIKRIGLDPDSLNGMTASQKRSAVKDAASAYFESNTDIDSETETENNPSPIADTAEASSPVNAGTTRTDAAQAAYEFGLYGASMEEMQDSFRTSGISEEEKLQAYNEGREKFIDLAKSQYRTAGMAGSGILHIDNLYASALTEQERANAYKEGREITRQARMRQAGGVYNENAGFKTSEYSQSLSANQVKMLDNSGKRMGVEIVYDSNLKNEENAVYDKANGRILLNPNAKNPVMVVLGHEMTHRMQQLSPKTYADFRESVANFFQSTFGDLDDRLSGIQTLYKNTVGEELSREAALDELTAEYAKDMLGSPEKFQRLVDGNRSLARKVMDALHELIQSIAAKVSGSYDELKQLRDIEKKWQAMYRDAERNAKQIEQVISPANATSEAVYTKQNGNSVPTDPKGEVQHSIKMDDQFMSLAISKNKLVDAETMKQAKKDRAAVASIMKRLQAEKKVGLPEDVEGNTFFADSSYGGSEENTTICPRSLASEAFMDAVSEYLGRPLSVSEQIYISQDLQGRTTTPECLYCYVATDRKAYREFLGSYIQQRDSVIEKLKAGDADTTRSGSLYQEFLNGRKDTSNMWKRFSLWVKDYRSGKKMITANHLTNMTKLMGDIGSEFGSEYKAQIKDAMAYAQSASWAKKRVSYLAYNGHILKWKQDRINKLNSHYGLRMYSFSDFHPAFILENMQMITDASVRGLKMLAYTKDTDFVKIFAGTGMNINVSCFAIEKNGTILENNLIGADWKQAQALREQHPNVGITFVTTNDKLTEWALAQDWVDVVIPYHLVRTGVEVAENLGYKNYTSESGDKKAPGWSKEHDKRSIAPTEHNNDFQTYMDALEKNHLTPRFERFKDNPNYMKLVNECRQSALESKPVSPVFDMDAARESLAKLEANGYYTPIGGSVDRMYEIASEVGENILSKDVQHSVAGLEEIADPSVRKKEVTKQFSAEIKAWQSAGSQDRQTLNVGSTGNIVQGLGAIESDIYIFGEKIKAILTDHPEITMKDIEKIPTILDDPVLVMESKNRNSDNSRIVLYGSEIGQNGKPILTILDLQPVEGRFEIKDLQKVTSAYTKTATQNRTAEENGKKFIEGSKMMYVDKKRATSLLRRIGFSMPIELLRHGFIGSISYDKNGVKFHGETFKNVFKDQTTSTQRSIDGLEDIARPRMSPERMTDVNVLENVANGMMQGELSIAEKNSMKIFQKNLDRIKERQGKIEEIRAKPGTMTLQDQNRIQNYEAQIARINKDLWSISQGNILQGVVSKTRKQLVETYGAIKPGEKASRESNVPQQTAKENRVSKTVRTAIEASATTDEMAEELQKRVVEGEFSYIPITDKEAKEKAEKSIKRKGWNDSLMDWSRDIAKTQFPGKDMVTTGFMLYNNAVQAGDTKTAVRILTDITNTVRNSAQVVQAVRILKQLSPENRLYAIQRQLDSLQEDLNKRYGDNAPQIDMNSQLVENYRLAEGEENIRAAEDALFRDIASKLPNTATDKWNSWRYLSMLGNLRTHVRNVAGNLGFAPVRSVKDKFAYVIESAWSHVDPDVRKTKSVLGFNKADRALLEVGKNDYSIAADLFETANTKSGDSISRIERMRPAFGGDKMVWRALSKASKFNSDLLSYEDGLFKKSTYSAAFAGYLKVNGVTAEMYQNGQISEEFLDQAREYAMEEALKATYNDFNEFSNFVAKLGKAKYSENKYVRFSSTAVDAILPFKRTPANILVRAVEYSPVGLLINIKTKIGDVRKGKISAAEAIDSIAAGLTGTVLLGIGMLFGHLGWVSGGDDEDDKQKDFDKLRGDQSYALNIGNYSYTIDWLAPEAIPMFVGVELQKAIDEKGRIEPKDLYKSLIRISNPLLEMSMLQGVNTLIDNVSYSDNKVYAILSSIVSSYILQAFPTLFGQIERTGEVERETSYYNKNSQLSRDAQYTISKAANKIPGVEYNQIPYIDAYGRRQSTGNIATRAFSNFVSPGYIGTDRSAPWDDELQRLYDAGQTNVFPTMPADTDIKGYVMSADELVKFRTEAGQMKYRLLEELMDSDLYNAMSDGDKAKTISDIYDFAKQYAKKQIVDDYEIDSSAQKIMDLMDIGYSYIDYLRLKNEAVNENGNFARDPVVDYIQKNFPKDKQRKVWNIVKNSKWSDDGTPFA